MRIRILQAEDGPSQPKKLAVKQTDGQPSPAEQSEICVALPLIDVWPASNGSGSTENAAVCVQVHPAAAVTAEAQAIAEAAQGLLPVAQGVKLPSNGASRTCQACAVAKVPPAKR